MEELETVSKVVDETCEKSETQEQSNNLNSLRSKASLNGISTDQYVSPGTSNGAIELTLAVGNEIEEGNETQAKAFDNPVFNFKKAILSQKRKSFADVVTDLLIEPIKVDVHPFGNGSIYSRSLGGEATSIHREEGTLFMWALVTLIILGVAVGVIMLSIMYQAEHNAQYSTGKELTDSNTTSYGSY